MNYTENQFIKLPYLLIHKIGIIPATVLVHLMDLQRNAFGNGEFYQQQNRMAESLGLSIDIIKRTIKKLKSLGLLKVKKKSVNGQPPKNFYDVNVTLYKKMLEETVSVKSTQSLVENTPIVSVKSTQSLVENTPTNTRQTETILTDTKEIKTRNDLVTSNNTSRLSNFYANREITSNDIENKFKDILN